MAKLNHTEQQALVTILRLTLQLASVTPEEEFAVEVLRSLLKTTKPVGRPRTRVHDETKANCSCSDCRKQRKEAREQLSHSEYSFD